MGSNYQPPSGSRRTRTALFVILVALVIALPVSRRFLYSVPPAPPHSAKIAVQMKYYSQRIAADPSDVAAYVELGKLDEAAGYFTDGLHHLYAARALGAKETDFILPLGRSLLFLGHFDDAANEMRKAVQLMPDSIRASCELADVYEAQDKRKEASETVLNYLNHHPAIESAPSSPEIVSQTEHLLEHFLNEDNADMALRMAENLIRVAPDRAQGYSVAGQILVTRKQYAQGVEKLQKAAAIAPNNAVICYSLGLALSGLGKDADAVIQWQRALTVDPRAVNACYRLAEAFDRQKDFPRCAAALQTIALKDMSSVGAAKATAFAFEKAHMTVPAAYWRAIEAGDNKDYAAEIKNAQIVLTDPPWRKRGLGAIAAAYHASNRMREYLAVISQETAPGSAEDDVTMATAFGAADRPDDQTRLLKRALSKSPKNPANIYLQLSQVASKQGLRDEAEEDLKKAIGLQPDIPGYRASLGTLYMERRSEGGRLDKAIEEFKALNRLDPNEPVGYQQLGIAYAAKGDLHRASHALEHTLDLQPGDGSTYQELAKVYSRMGNKTASEQMFALYKKYLTFDLQQKSLMTQSRERTQDPTAQAAVGEFLEQSGNYADALQYYRLANSLHPGDPAIKAKIQRMSTQLGLTTEQQ